MNLFCPVTAADVGVTYRADHAGVVDTSLDRVAAEEVLAGLPVREFRWYKGRRHYSGWYWSATVGRLMAYESRLELARIMLADFDPLVTAIAAQPFRLAGPDRHRTRRHVPDILLGYAAGGVTVVDVKAPGNRGDPEVRAVMGWTREVAGLRGWGFEEWYGADPGLLANVSFLAGWFRRCWRRQATGRRSRPSRSGPTPRQSWSGRWSCTCCGPAGWSPTWAGRWAA
jgi:hypothetical protein